MMKKIMVCIVAGFASGGCVPQSTVMPEQGMGEGGYDYTPSKRCGVPCGIYYDENRSDGLAGTEQDDYTAGLDLETDTWNSC